MVMIRLACALAVFVTCFTIQTYPQDKTKYPSREEINRVLPQAEAATIQYRHSLDQQQIKLGKSADEAVARDRKTLADLEMLLQAIKGNPDGFNGPAGFFVYETLGEIQKNALVCTISAMSKNAILFAVTGSGDKDLENLGKSCTDAATLILVVMGNVATLYENYLAAEHFRSSSNIEALKKCEAILKSHGLSP